MSDKTPTVLLPVPFAKLMFADGTTVWALRGTAADYIFTPVVLKNTTVCVLIYGLLVWRSDVSLLDPWQIVTLWMAVGLAIVLWLYVATAAATYLVQSRIIRFIFTPFITVPLVCVNEGVAQLVMSGFTGQALPPVASLLHFIIRDIIVVLLFDIQFGSYVAPRHPLITLTEPTDLLPAQSGPVARQDPLPSFVVPRMASLAGAVAGGQGGPALDATDRADTRPRPAKAELPAPDAAAAKAGQPMAAPPVAVTIGTESLRIADLVSIHAEDHYIRVQTRDRSLLLRGRFSEVVDRLGPDHGIQISRSDWVSRGQIATIQRTEDYKLFLILTDGQEHIAARARKADVLAYARSHDIPVQRRR